MSQEERRQGRGGRGGRGRQRGRPQRAEPDPDFEANWDTTINDFEQMDLKPELVHGIYSYGFKQPSQIQALAIKPIVDGRHIIAQAQSGTGKTGAFTTGILNAIDVTIPMTQAIILAPTRELAIQIHEFGISVGNKMNGLTSAIYIGGNSVQADEESASRLPHFVVATPGRALALIQSGHLRVGDLRIICLDEADEMLSEDFVAQVHEIFQYLNPNVQILLFSATIPPPVFEIAKTFMRDPIKILVKAEKLSLQGIQQFYVNVGESINKFDTLIDIYSRLPIQKAVIFANSKDVVNYLKEQMEESNFPVSAIHSGLTQQERNQIMQQFRVGATRVLIATDLIARGIDVQQVTLVINFELPNDFECYLHRIGRSGRYGRKGVAINICDNKESNSVHRLERFYQTEIKELPEDIAGVVAEANSSV